LSEKNKLIKLRPHHVEQLIFEPYFTIEWIKTGKIEEKHDEDITPEEIKKMMTRLGENNPLRNIIAAISKWWRPRGKEYYKNFLRLHGELINNPQILIVPGLDNFCEKCGWKECPFCKEPESDERISNLGLRIGKKYSMKEILQKLGADKKSSKKYFSYADKFKKLLKTQFAL
jgi:hypothetical protein